MVREHEWRLERRRINTGKSQLGWRITRTTIVIAPYEQNFYIGLARTPFSQNAQCFWRAALFCMQYIAKHDNAPGGRSFQTAVEPSQTFWRRPPRNEYS